jgi:hypothetical protein
VPDSGFENPYFSGRKEDHAKIKYLMSVDTRKAKEINMAYIASNLPSPVNIFTGILRCQPACCQRTHPTAHLYFLRINYKKY